MMMRTQLLINADRTGRFSDRLYRSFRDCVTLEDLDVEIHLPKEGQVISKDSKSQAKLVHGIAARHCQKLHRELAR
jgi:hypothetical protein